VRPDEWWGEKRREGGEGRRERGRGEEKETDP
jgi:hypothetical protein